MEPPKIKFLKIAKKGSIKTRSRGKSSKNSKGKGRKHTVLGKAITAAISVPSRYFIPGFDKIPFNPCSKTKDQYSVCILRFLKDTLSVYRRSGSRSGSLSKRSKKRITAQVK